MWTNERVVLILAVTAWAATMIAMLYIADLYQKTRKKLAKNAMNGVKNRVKRVSHRAKNTSTMIKYIRYKTGLSQQDVGEKLGVAQTTVCAWEHARSAPRAATYKTLQNWYKLIHK